tara:strand:- start:594 stop:1232 length:639 start_codon:yes stop_codon:yes gene_type:complete
MTGNEMLTNLGLRLEDVAQTVFTQAAKIDALNIAQKSVCNMIDNSYLVELQTIADNVAVSSGVCTFDTAFGASVNPLRNCITGIYDEDNDKWCTMIEPGEVKTLENSYLNGDTTNPVAYVFADKIYVKPTTVTSIDVWYIKAPTDLAANATECELNPALQEMVLDFAESQLWRMDGKSDRANIAYNNGINTVKVLNERYQVELATSIGRKGK